MDDQPGVVLDVRQASEVADGHLPGALAIELGALAGDRLPAELPEGPVTVMCGHGERAMTAASLLARAGLQDLRVAHGGPKEWQRATGQAMARSSPSRQQSAPVGCGWDYGPTWPSSASWSGSTP
jgi:rhodanese-related sulfurtransferase